MALIAPRVAAALGRALTPADRDLLQRSMPELKKRAPNLNDLAAGSLFCLRSPPNSDGRWRGQAASVGNCGGSGGGTGAPCRGHDWSAATVEEQARALADEFALKLGQVAQPLRAAVTGSSQSPGLFDVMATLGRDETLGRIDDVINGRAG